MWYKVDMLTLLKRPTGFMPLVISLLLLALILADVARAGGVRASDEGTAAHLFQILMPVQLAIIAFFAVRWLPRSPSPAKAVIALQIGAALAVFALVFALRL